ncbi:hypothetical protein SF1_20740 [Sphingobacterium faecium NBRC 15299]|nr:hypothetical protein C8N37_101772 [Sphingobacterium faecium]GEM64092.1 hypothetical protein SF1_20740 [Sphingobacterium faecium NBRC 15299]
MRLSQLGNSYGYEFHLLGGILLEELNRNLTMDRKSIVIVFIRKYRFLTVICFKTNIVSLS